MNTNQHNHRYPIKKRKPLLAALLSFFSLGLGQVYNGEILKGIGLNLIFWATFLWYGWYTVSAYFGPFYDLVFFLLIPCGFLLLKIYSIVQAYIRSRRLGKAYRLNPVNRWYVYLLFVLILLIPPFFLNNAIRNRVLSDTSSPHPFRSESARTAFLSHYDKQAGQWPVKFETRMVESAYGKTHVWISGPESAPPLVLLHGGPSNSLQWKANIEALSKDYRTYAIDIIIGTGRSINTVSIEKTTELVSWLDQTLTGLGLEDNINMMGLSYGGWITGQYALSGKKRLNNVILVAPAGTVSPLSMKWIKYAVLSLIPHPHFIRSFLYWVLPDFYRMDRAELDLHVEESFLAMRCFKPVKLLNPTVLTEKEWRRIQTPILLLIGENERIYSRNAFEVTSRINTLAPRVRTEVIPGAGHDLVFVQAERINSLVLEFLDPAAE